MFEGANDRWASIPPVLIGRVEEASNREGAARESDHDCVEFAGGGLNEQCGEKFVVEKVVSPSSAALAVVVDVCDLPSWRRQLVGSAVWPAEEVQEAQRLGVGGGRGHVRAGGGEVGSEGRRHGLAGCVRLGREGPVF